MCPGSKKLVILGIPWDVDSEELRQYMNQFGELADVMVMKDRASGRSRGFGYVIFSSSDDAEKALAAQHTFKGRSLEVKVATPKEEMTQAPKKNTRVFVARIPSSVTDEDFHSYFMKYGLIIDAYMPKDPVTKQHRGIGFVTYENFASVDKLISETHELGGSTIAVDQATPKEEIRSYRGPSHLIKTPRTYGFSNFNGSNNIDRNTRLTGRTEAQANKLSSSAVYSQQGLSLEPTISRSDSVSNNGDSVSNNGEAVRVEKKMFIGRVPVEATSEDLHAYFSQFGGVLDVYLPRDARKVSHRGFGFVTFADEASAVRVTRLRHYLFGREMAVESASPPDHTPGGGPFPTNMFSTLGAGQYTPCEVPGVASGIGGSVIPITTNKWGKKLFIGRIPIEATVIDLQLHFSQFGHVLDVYLPKDDKKRSHKGFGFVTFADEISAEYVSQKIHKILGQKIVLDRAAPLENGELNVDPSSCVTGGIHMLQSLSGQQQAYDTKLLQSQDISLTRMHRLASRYRPY